jgi:hypothetical protein
MQKASYLDASQNVVVLLRICVNDILLVDQLKKTFVGWVVASRRQKSNASITLVLKRTANISPESVQILQNAYIGTT